MADTVTTRRAVAATTGAMTLRVPYVAHSWWTRLLIRFGLRKSAMQKALDAIPTHIKHPVTVVLEYGPRRKQCDEQ